MKIPTSRTIAVVSALAVTALSIAYFLKGSDELPSVADNGAQAAPEAPMATVLVLAPRGSSLKTHS